MRRGQDVIAVMGLSNPNLKAAMNLRWKEAAIMVQRRVSVAARSVNGKLTPRYCGDGVVDPKRNAMMAMLSRRAASTVKRIAQFVITDAD